MGSRDERCREREARRHRPPDPVIHSSRSEPPLLGGGAGGPEGTPLRQRTLHFRRRPRERGARTKQMLQKPRITLLLAAGFGLLAATGVYRFLLRYDDMVEAREVMTQPVVVAARDIPFGTELAASDLSIATWPVEIAPREHFAGVDSLIGRINRAPLMAG